MRNVRSKFTMFTGVSVSQDVSHFAAFFIVLGPKTSTIEGCIVLGRPWHEPQANFIHISD